MDQETVSKANKLYNDGSIAELYELIKPYLAKDDPYAMYFCARFSLAEWNESDEEYDKRYLNLLTKAAEANVAEAMYQLSSLYFAGDTVARNIEEGRRYLNGSANLNYGPAILSLAINIYHGSNGYQKNVEKSIELVEEAVRNNVEGASDVLRKIRKRGRRD